MREWLLFLARMWEPLHDLYVYAKSVANGAPASEEHERQLAARIIRKASDEEMRRELQGGE